MIEKVAGVRNPLTVIAIFAGLAEVGGTMVLPMLREPVQDKYVWFLIVFPTVLVIAFFTILYLKPSAFYAPSDYKNEDIFRDLMRPQTATERMLSLQRAVEDVQALRIGSAVNHVYVADSGKGLERASESAVETERPVSRERMMEQSMLAEELVIAKLEKDRGWSVSRNVMAKADHDLSFDGVAESGQLFHVIEVIYGGAVKPAIVRTQQKMQQVQSFYDTLPPDRRARFRAHFVIVCNRPLNEDERDVLDALQGYSEQLRMSTTLQVLDLDALKKEMGW